MRWEQHICPTCGAPVWGVVNQITARVRNDAAGGSYDWEGESVLESQCDLHDDLGREHLICENGHVWWSAPVKEVTCVLCRQWVSADAAHWHQEQWIGVECWEDRLKASE